MELNTDLPLHPASALDCPNPASDRAPVLAEDALIASIDRKLKAGVEQHVSAGTELIELKKTVHRRFTEVVYRSGWCLDYVEKLMSIARTFPDFRNVAENLPPSWTTLHLLTRLPKDVRDAWITDGTIFPKLTYRGAEALLRRARKSNGHGDDHDADHDGDRDADRAEDHDVGHEDHDGDRDEDRDAGGDDQVDPRDGDEGRDQQAEGGEFTARADIGPDSQGEIERKLARGEELERQVFLWETQRTGLERRIQELEIRLNETDVPHQRRMFRQALHSLQQAESLRLPEKEKRFLRNSAMTDLIEFVRSAKRGGLGLNRFDIVCRPETH